MRCFISLIMSINRSKIYQIVESVSNELAVHVPEIKFQNRINLATARISNGKTVISFKSDIDSFEETFIETFVYYTIATINGKTDTEKFIEFEKALSQSIQTEEKKCKPNARSTKRRQNIHENMFIGKYWNLREIYDKIFGEYREIFEPFYGRKPPLLCWTRRRTFRIMAQYTFGENRVSISRSLDSPDTPELVLKYLMFHELLHGVVGKGAFRNQNMKLQHRPHSRRFKELEKLFPERDEAEALLKAIAKKSEKQIKQKRSIKPNGLD